MSIYSVNFLLVEKNKLAFAYHDIVKDSKMFVKSSIVNYERNISDLSISKEFTNPLNIKSEQELLVDAHYSNHSMHRVRSKRHQLEKQHEPLYQKLDMCRRVDFNVNFLELGWDKWIIFPTTFNAHICTGDCALPLQRMRKRKVHGSVKSRSAATAANAVATSATNHAQIMSILEFKHPGLNRQMTKCVSTKLKPLTVIFLNEQGQVKTKQYEDMIVDECGCR